MEQTDRISELERELKAATMAWENAELRCKELQAVIDEVQKQEPVAYGLKSLLGGHWDGVTLLDRLEAEGYDYDALVPLYAAPIPVQQSQAVAAPDEIIKWLQNFEKMTYNSGFLWMAKDAKRFLEIIQLQKVNRESIALILLGKIFDLYENGVDCYEDPDDMRNYIGKAFELDDETFEACVNILNGNPADQSPRITEQDEHAIKNRRTGDIRVACPSDVLPEFKE